MKRLFSVLLCIVCAVCARGEQRLLTMEDAILSKALVPASYHISWHGAPMGCYLHRCDDGGWQQIEVRSGRVKPYTLPETAATPHAELRENNIVWVDASGAEYRVTEYEDRAVVCGSSVSRNEFGITGGLFPSPDNTKLAFYRKDESRVTTFPLLDISTRTGSLVPLRYPMNGMASEHVSIGVYDVAERSVVYLDVTDFDEERYLTNVAWSPDSRTIYVQVVNREQKQMRLNSYCAQTGALIERVLEEQNAKWVEPQHPLYFIDNARYLYITSNRHGFRNIYLGRVGEDGLERLTKVDADVEYVAHHGRYIYYYTAEFSPVERHLCRVDMHTGKVLRLTTAAGWHTCQISDDGRYFSDDYSSLTVPRIVELASTDGRMRREVFRAADPSQGYNYCDIELGTVKSADGRYDNHYRLIRPLNFDATRKYPVIHYVYGGPHSQLVRNTFQAQLRRWEMYMAQRGYVVFVMDNRGTANRGLEYEQAIHGMCGKHEMEDQVAGLRWLLSHPWVDAERVGVHGWSYGGFMTISLMVNYPQLYKVGVAGGPVIDWRWYEVMYGERYMETERTNAAGMDATSLIPRAKDLKGRLLICQGAVDDVVVWQHSLSFVESCIKAGVDVDYFPYPTHKHNVRGRDRVHLMNKVTRYFEDFLR